MIDQMERMNALLDAYEQLLTEKQREILNLYYKEDLSFFRDCGESAHQPCGCQRSYQAQHAYSCGIRKKLHLVQNYETRSRIYDKMKTVGNDAIRKLVEQLENLE